MMVVQAKMMVMQKLRRHTNNVLCSSTKRQRYNQPTEGASVCPKSHREEWNQEIEELIQSKEPEITIGCFRGTGVGKSSLHKALLNEDNILPTTSSRGCTAAVVELNFNRTFCNARPQPIDVYLGTVQFLSLQDWLDELQLLIGDCCDDESQKVSQSKREKSEEAKASWSKIDAVYGQGTMKSHKDKTKESVFMILSEDETIVSLLCCDNKESIQTFNRVDISEGKVSPDQASAPLSILSDPSSASAACVCGSQKETPGSS